MSIHQYLIAQISTFNMYLLSIHFGISCALYELSLGSYNDYLSVFYLLSTAILIFAKRIYLLIKSLYLIYLDFDIFNKYSGKLNLIYDLNCMVFRCHKILPRTS